MTLRPLPRSLDPLPDESIDGFLLRLAHRLDLTPSRVALLTGLASVQGVARVRLQLRISPDQAAALAKTTRLTPFEAGQLCLDSLRDHYPPLEMDYTDEPFVRRSKGLPPVPGWILSHSTRYCPACLAGDGSAIQQAHGGPWRKHWRLAVVFACTTHRRLLRHRCPRCDTPALQRTSINARLFTEHKLIQHPTHCRARPRSATSDGTPPLCGHPLGLESNPGRHDLTGDHQHLLDLQHRLLTRMHLQPGQAPDVVSGRHYFYDLNLITRLIRGSWPFAAAFAPSHLDTALIDSHVDELDRETTLGRIEGKRPAIRRLRGGPPEDPRACAALLTLAEHIHGDHEKRRALIESVPGTTTWFRELEAFLMHCSPQMLAAGTPHLRATLPEAGPATTPEKAVRKPQLPTHVTTSAHK